MIKESGQDNTDFAKSLEHLQTLWKAGKASGSGSDRKRVIVLGALEGRFDQTMDNVNTLLLLAHEPEVCIFLKGKKNVACVLPPGHHRVVLSQAKENEQGSGAGGIVCGLIPLNGPCKVVTQGLKWNLGGPFMPLSSSLLPSVF